MHDKLTHLDKIHTSLGWSEEKKACGNRKKSVYHRAVAYPRGGKCIMGDNDQNFRFIKSLDLIRGKINKKNLKKMVLRFFSSERAENRCFWDVFP